ncbi:MAG: SMP-30/gluconolactonase/LRE family protein [Bacteroidetes bacterium]|nr:SMP-30/gluconolactonase/LRE family protein [Bacteroidota bacterium]
MKSSLLYDCKSELTEGPIWHAAWNSFLWVDIEGGYLYRYNLEDKRVTSWDFPHRLTLVVETSSDKLLLALDAKLALFDPIMESLEWLVDLYPGNTSLRCNDGACDPQGRLWVGTMSLQMTQGVAALFRLDKDLVPKEMVSNVTISNGLSWSLDGKIMYYIDSPTQKVQAFHFDSQTGNIRFKKDVILVPEKFGTPDGMCMDENGMLWIGHYGGSGIFCWNPETGKLVDKIEVPAPHVTSCAFGGPQGNQLLITTARENMSDEKLEEYPLSGSVFIAEMPVTGAPVFSCNI